MLVLVDYKSNQIKAGKGQSNHQIIETSYWTFEFAWQNNTNADFHGTWGYLETCSM